MGEHANVADVDVAHASGGVSVAGIVLAGLLIGAGLIGIAYWLLTFDWLLFLSFAPLTVGALLLFSRATGAEHA